MAVSSLNRSSYFEPVSTSSFKESGSIEYSADVLMGIQFDDPDGKLENASEHCYKKLILKKIDENKKLASQGKTLDLQIKILKNRYGNTGNCPIEFCPKFSCYTDRATCFEEALNGVELSDEDSSDEKTQWKITAQA